MRNNPSRETSLTDEQQEAYEKVSDILLTDGGAVASLKGYAGTGKTHLLRYMVDQFGPEFNETYMMAPTHKAADVLGRRTGYEVDTIHSAFGLRPVWDGRGGYKFEPSGDDPKKFVWGSFAAIDEGSMIPQKLYDHLMDAMERWNLSLVISGDPAQLPPVNENPSPALDHDGYMLESIVRQEKDNPIIQTSMEIRESSPNPITTNTVGDQGVEVVDNYSDFIGEAYEEFDTSLYRNRGDHVRVLAYRNDTVETYNGIFRDLLYGDTGEQFIEGEWLIAQEPWYGVNRDKMAPVIQNSEEFVVLDKEPGELYGFDTWVLEIASNPKGDNVRHIEVLNRDELDRYDQKLDSLANKAKNGKKSLWKKYYDYKETFAQVDYSYALTTHKSQGSTFTRTFVDLDDIEACRDPEEKKRLKYVAVTRASDKLTVLKS